MGRKLTSNVQGSPLLNIKSVANSFVQGEVTDRKEVKTEYGQKPVYTLKLEETSMGAVAKQDGKYIEITVGAGDLVSFFAPTLLDKALVQANPGDRVRIVYLGLGKAKKGRNA